ncbi:hypothetical protein XBKQ1_530014 [Xenorhabdus bovienii str. kraussei Quebec]|uniref:Uncharacterized protein n=1 Tax=Xenorhabdus bovienii str. kraussei Quebec TaxID=1398203 RepID=A0A077PKH2_XENBV|nr:hypothetical protein XBKQ1_530014 [Xenorhabdus bovienii str. kraussei Quebec]
MLFHDFLLILEGIDITARLSRYPLEIGIVTIVKLNGDDKSEQVTTDRQNCC